MQFFKALVIAALSSGVLSYSNDKLPVIQETVPMAASSCRAITDDIVYDCGSPNDAFIIKRAILTPRRPRKGASLTVNLIGDIKDPIINGSNGHSIVKLGIFKVAEDDYDLCEKAKENNEECPIQVGYYNATTVYDIKSDTPSGNYVVDAYAHLPNKKQISRIQLKFRL